MYSSREMASFYILKNALLRKYREEHPAWEGSIHDFKTREIANFQNQLEKTVGGRVSEKWFYTHIKPQENKKLPRIDTLDLLSAFLGYENWDDFVYRHKKDTLSKDLDTANRPSFILTKVALILIGSLLLLLTAANLCFTSKSDYNICFIDADTGFKLDQKISISILRKDESPMIVATDENACAVFKEINWPLRFTVSAPYYKSDTIMRTFQKNRKNETIKLHKDDFALMIHLFSKNEVSEWKKRREQLNLMFDNNAIIFQVNDKNLGLEMYNKTEFINKLTMPINSLKNIQILETHYHKGRILEMRFVQK